SGSSRCRLTRANGDDPLPSLHEHYTRFDATTEQSAPNRRIGLRGIVTLHSVCQRIPASFWGALGCPTKATDYTHSDRKGYVGDTANDPRHGTPCACAHGRFCRGVDASHMPWRKQQSVADQGNKGAAARAPLAAPTKEHAKAFADPCAPFQGRGGARSLETGHHRPFSATQDLSDLSVVGRSWAEVAGGRPSGSGGVLYSYAEVDESQLQLLSCDQRRLPQQLRQSKQPRRQLSHDPWRLLVERLLCHDRRTDKRDLFAGARLAPRRPAVIPGPGLSVPHDAGESGTASQ